MTATALIARNGQNGRMRIPPGTIPDELQPHNVEAERAVLGALLIDPDAIIQIDSFLLSGDFYLGRHGWIYDVVQHLYAGRRAVDFVTVCDELEQREQLREAGGGAYLTELIEQTPSSIHIEYYARIVERSAFKRRLIRGAGEISRLAFENGGEIEDVASEAEEIIFGITSRRGNHNEAMPIRDTLDKIWDQIEYLQDHQTAIIGLPTGLRDLDALLGGLQKECVYTLAGRPGMGKSAMALGIARHIAKIHKRRVLMFSVEMGDEQLVRRLLSMETGIETGRLKCGQINQDEYPTLIKAIQVLSSNVPILIDDTPSLNANSLRSKARRLHAEYGLDLIIIDYLQLMAGQRAENRQQEVSDISRAIKCLARELNIPIISVSQLSRKCEERHDKRPMLSDLRDSGSIEQDSDAVMFIYRDEIYNPDTEFPSVAEVIIAKHREGPTGKFSVYFKKNITQFVDLEVKTQMLNYEPMPKNGHGARSLDQIVKEYTEAQ